MRRPAHQESERTGSTRSRPGRWLGQLFALAVSLSIPVTGVLLVQQREADGRAAARTSLTAPHPVRLADFRGHDASADARLVADWVAATGDNGGHAFMIVDKKNARVFAFTPEARLEDSAPALLGEAVGDELLAGSAGKEPAQMGPEEKITPAGRFVAETGVNADQEDVIWVDYEAAISMHRVRTTVRGERRLERLASASPQDNRISFGCINVPPAFYERVAKALVEEDGAVVYVLPETMPLQAALGAHDAAAPFALAAARHAPATGSPARSPGRDPAGA